MEQPLDFARARYNMVEKQIRTWEVLDQRVLELLHRIPREDYVPAHCRVLAYSDMELPMGHGEVMLAPKIQARLAQSLALKPGDRILEVGTGTGYLTALLAGLCAHVYSVDIVPEFTRDAAARLAAHGVTNVTLETGDAARGWATHAPYDAIVLTGSVPLLPDAFARSLRPGGRLLAVVGEPPAMEVRLITCATTGACHAVGLFDTCIAPLRNVLQPERFVF